MLVASKLPSKGPQIIRIPDVSSALAPGATVETFYRWPRKFVLAGVMLLPTLSTAADLAAAAASLSFSCIDDDGQSLMTDTVGTDADCEFLPALSLSGVGAAVALTGQGLTPGGGPVYAPRWHAFSRVVLGGEQWRIRVRNQSAADTITAALMFRVEDPR